MAAITTWNDLDNSDIRIIQVGENGDHHISNRNNNLNSLSASVRSCLLRSIKNAEADPNVKGIVLIGQGSTNFSAGFDIREFQLEQPSDSSSLADICDALQNSSKPSVSAIRGFCLGGGLEISLSCDFRVATSSSLLGLPEVSIGLIPGAGGTQRLPRLTSVRFALDVITSGRMISSKEARDEKLVDAIVNSDENLEEVAIQWAKWGYYLGPSVIRTTRKLQFRRVVDGNKEQQSNLDLCKEYAQRKLPSVSQGGEAKQIAVCAIQASFDPPNSSFEDGLHAEEVFFQDLLLNSKQGKALRYAFFAERSAQQQHHRISSSSSSSSFSSLETIQHIGVIGAGTMGQGIVISLLLANYKVTLVDVNSSGLAKGVSFIQATVARRNKKIDINKQLASSTDISALSSCHVVIEAVFEDLKLKQDIFGKLNTLLSNPDSLLLTNTSTLNISEIFAHVSVTKLPNCCGMHFFSPAHVMRLVEIVTTKDTSDKTIQLVRSICKKIKKIGVVVGNCDGFVGNRMIFPYSSEAVLCLEEGSTTVMEVDKALQNFGMAIGPFVMSDLASNDIGYLIRKSKGLVRDETTGLAGPGRFNGMRYSEIADDLNVLLKRVGQKALKGWYDYDAKHGNGRKPLPSKEVAEFLSKYRKVDNFLDPFEIVRRLLFPLVNEGFKILEEGIANSPGDIDVIYLFGYGFPRYRGGPMYWAENEVGLPNLLATLEGYYEQYPGSAYFKPSELLRQCVSRNLSVQEYCSSIRKKENETVSSRL